MKRSLRRPLRLLATSGVVVSVLAVLAPTPAPALPNCGYAVTYYSDAAKTDPVGWRYAEPAVCGCGVTFVGDPGRYTSVSLLTSCLP